MFAQVSVYVPTVRVSRWTYTPFTKVSTPARAHAAGSYTCLLKCLLDVCDVCVYCRVVQLTHASHACVVSSACSSEFLLHTFCQQTSVYTG